MTEWDDLPLIDFSLFPNNTITNLELHEIEEVLNVKNEDTQQRENDHQFPDSDEIPESVLRDLDEIEKNMKSMSSHKQEIDHSKRLMNFLSEKDLSVNLETVSEKSLNEYLRWFYSELRTKKNEYYSPASLKCIRAGIHRYMTTTLKRLINIIDGDFFKSANRMLTTMCALWLSNGGRATEYISIEKNDMKKIMDSFKRSSGENLQNEVIFSILFFLGARGREEFKRLRRSDISINTDSEEKKFVSITATNSDNIRKNVKPSLKMKDYSNNRINRIYDERAIETIQIYLERLNHDVPNSDELFPRPIISKNRKCFYSDKQVRGEHWLGDFMKTVSKKLELSQSYTNHCVRCTTITAAKEKGLSNSDISMITGHKNTNTVNRYDRPSDSRKYRIANTISLTDSSTHGSTVTNGILENHTETRETDQPTTSQNELENVMNILKHSTGNNIQVFSNCNVTFQR